MPKSKKQKTSHHHNQQYQHQQRKNDRILTEAEIWDDSALIRSWDEAVKEYEFYHSIAARGEDVEEVLRRAELEEDGEKLLGDDDGVQTGNHDMIQGKENGTHAPVLPEAEVEDGEIGESEADDGELGAENEGIAGNGGASEAEAVLIGPRQPRPHVNGDLGEIKSKNTELAAQSSSAQSSASTSVPIPVTDVAESAAADAVPGAPEGATTEAGSADQTLENLKMAYWWAGYYSGLYDGQRQKSG